MRNINNITIKFNIFSNITNKRNNNSISIFSYYIPNSHTDSNKITFNTNFFTKMITIIKFSNYTNSGTFIITKRISNNKSLFFKFF